MSGEEPINLTRSHCELIATALHDHAKLCAKRFGGEGDPVSLQTASAAMDLSAAIERLAKSAERRNAHHDDPVVFVYTTHAFTHVKRVGE